MKINWKHISNDEESLTWKFCQYKISIVNIERTILEEIKTKNKVKKLYNNKQKISIVHIIVENQYSKITNIMWY